MLIKRFVGCLGVTLLIQHANFAGAGPMALSGNASVSEMGAGIYQLPIDVPPGAGELEPKLQLHYNSQAANGIVGTRWAISGLSSISRCPRTIAQDGVKGGVSFDTNDRFCLDGERLMVVSGTYGAAGAEYRTERDVFSKIVSYGNAGVGPQYFVVWTKDGEVLQYGATTDSRIEAQGKPNVVRVWAVNRVSDSKNNYRTISYSEDNANGYYYPTRVDYTGNSSTGQVPTSSVQFQYESRTDQEVLYLAGSIVKPTLRLSKIIAANGASVVSEYRLSYGVSSGTNNSRLLSVTKCGGDGACLPAVSVGWTGVAATIPSTPSTSTTESFTNNLFTPARVRWLSGDINGDGRDDLVLITVNSQYNILRRTWKADANGNLVLDGSAQETTFNANLFNDMQAALIDTNADGRKDLVLAWTTAVGEVGKAVWLADASGNFPATYSSRSISTAFSPQTYSNKVFNFGDINGDGRDDIVWSWSYGGTFNRVVWLADSSGGFAVAPSSSRTGETGNSSVLAIPQHTMLGDVNGDAIPDLIMFWHEPPNVHKVVWLGNPDGTFPNTASSHEVESGFSQPYNWYASQRVFLTDVNADGRMDISWAWTWSASNAGPGRSVWVSKGNGTFGNRASFSEESIPNFDSTFCNQSVQFISLDINGDNRSDLLLTCSYLNNLFFVSWLTRPDGSLPATYSSSTQYTGYTLGSMMSDRSFLPSDVNGDGKNDLIFAWRNNSTTLGRAVHLATAGLVDQVGSVSNGIGDTDSFSYVPMTDQSIYGTSGAATVYPQKNVRFPLAVVKSLSESNDVGGTMTTNYIYAGARSDINGRGFLGFDLVQGSQVETGLVTRTTFRQDWPYLSQKRSVTKLYGSTVLEMIDNTFSCKNPSSGSACTVAAGQRYFPYVSQQVHTKTDLNGSAMPSTTTTWQYDNYGNPTLVNRTSSDGYSKAITSTYLNDTTNWFIGRQTKSTTVGVSP